MTKTTSTPLPNQRYKDAHGHWVTVVSVEHNRVTFFREGYEFPCVQPLAQFLEYFSLLDGGSHA
ncbi:DUF4222 domain-containing protein [Pectobacterium polonicum]|uniref:DUF4222 domain-containing protein n=1 Tax=Pectobacterium polonicum TaxID=2485124 RepID=A0ABV1PGP4_9GAMM